MNALGGDYLLLAWVGVSILSTGIALCHAWSNFRGIELIGYGAAAGIVLHALLGLSMALLWPTRLAAVSVLMILPVAALAYWWRREVWTELLRWLPRTTRWSLVIWLLFLVVCVGITHLEVNFPAVLPDGRYVFKRHTLNVKIQYMTTLPCDNYLPYVVTEYLLRHISFQEERPLLPNNEVSNRTILMSLTALPFRAALGIADAPKPLGKFHYAGQDWPDVEKLNENGIFEQFLVIGIFLNSLLLVGLLVLFSRLRAREILTTGALLYGTNLYLLSQTIFTWPKAMCAFFILLAWNSLNTKRDPKLVALCLALAYHCHPYAAAFALAIGLSYCWQWWQNATRLRPMAEFTIVFFLSILPWFLWTRFYLGIPSNLVAQNFASTASPVDFLWVRVMNCYTLLTPGFLGVYPFDAATIVESCVSYLPGAVGLFVIVPAFLRFSSWPPALRWPIVISALAIVGVFSTPSLPVMHGYQPIVGVLLFLGLASLRHTVSPRTFWVVVSLQLLANVGLVVMQGWVVGAHFS